MFIELSTTLQSLSKIFMVVIKIYLVKIVSGILSVKKDKKLLLKINTVKIKKWKIVYVLD